MDDPLFFVYLKKLPKIYRKVIFCFGIWIESRKKTFRQTGPGGDFPESLVQFGNADSHIGKAFYGQDNCSSPKFVYKYKEIYKQGLSFTFFSCF